jgi:hypothetical protein
VIQPGLVVGGWGVADYWGVGGLESQRFALMNKSDGAAVLVLFGRVRGLLVVGSDRAENPTLLKAVLP